MGPVLAGERNTFSQPGRELLPPLLPALPPWLVRKGAASDFWFDPLGGLGVQGRVWLVLTRYQFYSLGHPGSLLDAPASPLAVPRAGLTLYVATEFVGN
jgi:hypothetical protein